MMKIRQHEASRRLAVGLAISVNNPVANAIAPDDRGQSKQINAAADRDAQGQERGLSVIKPGLQQASAVW